MKMKDFEKQVSKAKEELSKNSYRDIQSETAYKWAARACASYENVLTGSRGRKFACYLLAQEYEHEAIEHASLAPKSSEDLVKEIHDLISLYHAKAYQELEMVLDI